MLKNFWENICSDLKIIFKELLPSPFNGNHKMIQDGNHYSFIMLLCVVAFALFGFAELVSVYLPQFYDKIELPVWSWPEILLILITFGGLVILLGFGKKINDKVDSIPRSKTILPYLKLFCFICFNVWVFFAARAYPGTMKGYKTLLGQFSSLVIGFSCFIYISDLPLRKLRKLSGLFIFAACFLLLVIQFLPLFDSPDAGGVHRAFKGIQVCDLLAPMTVLFLSWLGVQDKINKWLILLSYLVFYGTVIGVIWIFQSNFSTAALYACIALITAWNGSLISKMPILNKLSFDKEKKTLLGGVVFVIVAGIVVLGTLQYKGVKLIDGSVSYRNARFANWVNYDADVLLRPKKDKEGIAEDYIKYINGAGAQGFYSKIAIMRGGIIPKGAGSSVVNNKRKLEVSWADFIFAVMCSEYGFIIMAGIILLVAWIMLLFYKQFVSYYFKGQRFTNQFPNQKDAPQGLESIKDSDFLVRLADGVFIYFAVVIIAHVYVNLSMLPNTGLPLPLFSLGGASLIINMVMLGVLFNLTKSPKR